MYRLEVTAPAGSLVIRLEAEDWSDLMLAWAGIRNVWQWKTDGMPLNDPKTPPPATGVAIVKKIGTDGQFREGWYGHVSVVVL